MSCPENYKLTNDASRCEIINQPPNTWYNSKENTYYSNTPKGYKYDGNTKTYYDPDGVKPTCSDKSAWYDENGKCMKSSDIINKEKSGSRYKDCPTGTKS